MAKEETKTRERKNYFFYAEGKGFLQKDYKFGTGERLVSNGLKNAEMIKGMIKASQNIEVDVLMKVL